MVGADITISTVKRPLFKVIERDGREYTIFTNGDIEGFGPDAYVINYYAEISAMETARRGQLIIAITAEAAAEKLRHPQFDCHEHWPKWKEIVAMAEAIPGE